MEDPGIISLTPLLFILPFVVLLPLYIQAEKQGGFKKPTTLKVILSSLCALCALTGYLINGFEVEPWRILIVVALLCAVFGDYYLQYIQLNTKKYTIGLVCFSLTQVFLICFLCLRYGVSWPEFVVTGLFVALALVLIKKLEWQLDNTTVPLIIYITLLVFMASKAVLALSGGTEVTLSVGLMASGAVLFVVSDVLTGINNFGSNKSVLGDLHLVAYFCALILIAFSCSF